MGSFLIPFFNKTEKQNNMLKIYRASTDVCFSINYHRGFKRVSFHGKSTGGSVYYTRDEDEQKGIEEHAWFGGLIKLEETVDEAKAAEEQKKAAAQKAKKQKEDSKIVKDVSSLAEAKDWLADKTGVSRTKMRDKASILQIAQEHNIELRGL